MRKIELLSPAGSKESFYAAINAGTDAIYLGGKLFSARAYASNFSNEELKELIIYAHLRNVKVYVTVNTLVFEEEFFEAIKFIEFLYRNNVDAILLQDLGLASYIHKVYPSLEIHASTQLNCHNISEAKALMKLGFKRIVLARETPLHLVREIKRLGVEVEVFVHGALCVSYSGQCLMSSLIGNRSGNRGKCAQPCRNYMICEGDNRRSTEFAISMKDLCTIDRIGELIECEIDSLKIEGRMKREEYVYEVVSSYRLSIDAYMNEKKIDVEILKENMKKLFNRDFTKGFIFDESRTKTLNQKTSSHIGTHLGKVISKSKNYAFILLDDDVELNDGIRFNNRKQIGQVVQKMFVDGMNVNSAKKGDTIKLLLHNNDILVGDEVIKTTSNNQLDEIHNKMKRIKKVGISLSLYAYLYKPLVLEGECNGIKLSITSSYIVEESKNNLDIEKLRLQMNRLGNTVFELSDFKYYGDCNSFIPNSVLNEIRRNLLEDMEKKIYAYIEEKKVIKNEYSSHIRINNEPFKIYAQVENEEQLDVCLNYPYDKIFIRNKEVYKKYQDEERILYVSPRIDESECDSSIDKEVISYLKIIDGKNNIASPYMNVTNSYALDYLFENNIEEVILSYELSKNHIKSMIEEFYKRHKVFPNTIMPLYGYIDLMVMKSCPISSMYGLKNDHCLLCKKNHYHLSDRMKAKFEMIHDENCNTRILNSLPLYLIDYLNEIKEIGVLGGIVVFTNEKEAETDNVSNILFNKVENDIELEFNKKSTRGHYKNSTQ